MEENVLAVRTDALPVLIIGAGIAGMTTALELAEHGREVYLIDKEASLGGQSAKYCCKATEKCQHCAACLVLQVLSKVRTNEKITVLTKTRLYHLEGKKDNFTATLKKEPRYVEVEKCYACGLCSGVCSVKAISMPFPYALPSAYCVDESRCLYLQGESCQKHCVTVCPAGCINLEEEAEEIKLRVSDVVVAVGFKPYNAKKKPHFGYGLFEGVITGLELEEQIRKYGGLNCKPKDIAFIQCVGSRDEQRNYCSKVCCAYALRLANLLKKLDPSVNITIFYMDIQNFGKDFARFYEECQKKITFKRGIPAQVEKTERLRLKYEDTETGKLKREEFDLLVLSIGICPSEDNEDLASILRISLDKTGFFQTTDMFSQSKTNVEGIYVAGACQSPKSITESIAHGKEAALEVIGVSYG